MRLQLMTWQEVETYLKGRQDIILPIGSTEQHGPMGLIGTDAQTAEAVAWGVGEETGAIVGPTFNIGMALHHLDFPGSMSLRPSTLIAVLKDSLVSLARHGFRRFFFINGHGGNIMTVNAAFSEIYWECESQWNIDDIKCKLNSWFIHPEVTKMVEELYGDKEGFHATPSEVAMTQYLFPDATKTMAQVPVEPIKHPAIYGSKQFRQQFSDGRMASDSTLASPEAGKKILDHAIASVGRDYRRFVEA